MATTLSATLASLNGIKRRSSFARTSLRLVRAVVLGSVAVSIWSLVRPQQELEQLALGALTFLIAVLATLSGRGSHRIGLDDLALSLEMKHAGKTSTSLRSDAPTAHVPADWRPLLAKEVDELRRFEIGRNFALASTLVLPLAISFMTLPNTAPSFKLALSEVSNAVSALSRGASIRIVQGSANEITDKEITLSSSKPVEIELLSQNLIEIKVTGGGFGGTAPIVELRRRPGADGFEGTADGEVKSGSDADAGPAVFQSFQMSPQRDDSDNGAGSRDVSRYSISFAVTEAVELYIPFIDETKALAFVKVRQLPIPKVKLSVTNELEDPWPDDQPLNFRIQVKAENPLQLVRLLIRSGQRVSKELVANVMVEDKLELTTDYRLVLEQYVESDLAEVEIVAEAIDRSVPAPLAGYSEPIKIKTASAYGRYRNALQTLRELKQHIDDAVQKQQAKLPKEARELAAKAGEQSEKSPFFDGLDRVQIHRFESRMEEMNVEPDQEKLMELSQGLNDFLFEHEILDDRERDRDFFVAARGLSRLIEQDQSKRPVAVKTVTERLRKFLDDRHVRWAKRVERLPDGSKPPMWSSIRDGKPFHSATTRIDKLDEELKARPQAKSDQITALSKAVVEYRTWIENLESQEDKAREQEEQKRQEGLASARDAMRELQQRQGEISADLDRAGERPKGELDAQWPSARMKQNTNAKETKRLEGQLRSLSPTANNRIQAAVKAMEGTSESGNSGDYQLAESSSDMAGRLLRQAERAASQSQQKRKNRGRRRRVTGDNYYGQSVVGGDIEIKREYQVDRRYREDILNEVQNSSYDEDDRALLESYLRQIIR